MSAHTLLLRLGPELKARIEAESARARMSQHAWVLGLISAALEDDPYRLGYQDGCHDAINAIVAVANEHGIPVGVPSAKGGPDGG